jgi:hypothetical protein
VEPIFAAMRKHFIIAALVVITVPVQLLAWGRKGHTIVAEIAMSLCDSSTRATVIKQLGGMSLGDAGNWMDDMRSNHKYDYLKTWHYVNIEKGKLFVASEEPNIVNAITKAINNLQRRPGMASEDVKFNLLLLFHLVGDFHQPLHVGYAMDKGGNDVQVKYLGKPSNLHRVWDTDIIESEGISVNSCLLHYGRYDKDDLAQLRTTDVVKWINQPRSLLSRVYSFQDDTIDPAYVARQKKIVEEQLLIAGIRLSFVLQQVFK